MSEAELIAQGTHMKCPFCQNTISKESVHCSFCKKFVGNMAESKAGTCPTCGQELVKGE